jgi:molybdate transport system substrate-binding protein
MSSKASPIRRAYVLGPILLALSGCNRGGVDAGAEPDLDPGKPILVAAASDLQEVLPRLLMPFTVKSGIITIATPDASGRLAEQIKAGAPYDLFLSANRKFVDDLAHAGLIVPETVQDYALGSLVLCVGESAAGRVKRLEDLKALEVKKIAIANPEYAPYGVAARQALERAGLWSGLEPRIVRADSVRQALFYVRNGDAEAALVSRALIDPKQDRIVEVDPALHDPLVQSLGVVASSRRREDAIALARFITGPDGQAILHGAGFKKADSEALPGRSRNPDVAPPSPKRG